MLNVVPMSPKTLNAPSAANENAAAPLRFSKAFRDMLVAIPYARPGWETLMGECDDGDETSVLSDETWTASLGVFPIRAGTVRVTTTEFAHMGDFTDPNALRAALLDLIDTFDPDAT